MRRRLRLLPGRRSIRLRPLSRIRSRAGGYALPRRRTSACCRSEYTTQRQVESQPRNRDNPRPKFVLDAAPPSAVAITCSQPAHEDGPASTEPTEALLSGQKVQQEPLLTHPVDSSWRDEVTARLHSYQARRRPRAPRYPSLRLKFETSEQCATSSARDSDSYALTPASQGSLGQIAASRQSVAMDCAPVIAEPAPTPPSPAIGRCAAEPAPIQSGAGKNHSISPARVRAAHCLQRSC